MLHPLLVISSVSSLLTVSELILMGSLGLKNLFIFGKNESVFLWSIFLYCVSQYLVYDDA